MKQRYRLAVLQSHPIQYFAPLFRRLALEPDIDLMVYYCSHQGVIAYFDHEFGRPVQWDTPLLEGYPHTFLPNLRRQDRVGNAFSLLNPTIFTELRRGHYDALWVHGHNYATYLLAIAAAKSLRLPVLMRCETHLGLGRSRLKRLLRRPIMTLFYQQFCRACLPIGTRNRAFYRFHGVPDDRLYPVPYTVDNRFFMEAVARYREQGKAVRAELGLPIDKAVILFASKLTARKRPLDLLSAYRVLRHQRDDAALVFVGSGEEEEALREYVTAHQLPDIHFYGFRNQSELPKFYASADIFVLPSENEPWGLIINEIMCAGLPIVATEEIGAVADLVKDGYNGLTFHAGAIDQLTAHLIALVGDPALRDQMGARSLALITEWDLEHSIAGIRAALAGVSKG